MTSALQHVGRGATQTTQIEQARAVADVLAAIEAARRWPRDEERAAEKMETACRRRLVAESAFWSFPRSGETLTGPSIKLARAIASIWTNMQWGTAELSRDDDAGTSQMIAWAWDLETNVRPSTAWIVPHFRDVKEKGTGRRKRVKLDELRDVYENNANNGARRVREMILGLLPDWYVETATDTCRGVIERKDEPIEAIRADTAKALKPLGVELPLVLARVGRTRWNDTTRGDLATLRIIAKTIERGEGTVRELFPDVETREQLTARDLTERPADAQPLAAHVEGGPAKTAEGDAAPVEKPPPITTRTRNALFALFAEAGLGDSKDAVQRAKRLRVCEILAEPAQPLTTSNDLTDEEGRVVRDLLRAAADKPAYVTQLLADDDAQRAEDAAAGES